MDRATLDQLEVQERMQEIAMQISHIEEDNSEYYVEDIDIAPDTLEENDNGLDVTPHAIELQNITPENNTILNNATISRLVSELHDRNVEYTTLEMRSNHAELQVSALMTREREQREQIATLEYQQAVAEEHIMLLESKLATISEFEQGSSRSDFTLESLRGRLLSAANARIAELEAEAKQLREEHENGQLELDRCRVQLQARLQATEKELKECTKQLAQRTVLYSAQERRFLEYQRTSQATMSEDKYALVTCQAKLAQVTSQLTQSNEEKLQSSLKIRDLEAAVADFSEKITLSNAKIAELEEELSTAMSVNNELQATVSRLKGSDVEELERQMADEVEAIRSASHREMDALRHQLEQAQRVIQEESAVREQLEETLRDLEITNRSTSARHQDTIPKDEPGAVAQVDIGVSGGYSELLWDQDQETECSSEHNTFVIHESMILDKVCDVLDSISRWMSTAAMEAESNGDDVSMERVVRLGVSKYFESDTRDTAYAGHAARIQCHLMAVLSFMDCCRNPDAAPLRSGLMEGFLVGEDKNAKSLGSEIDEVAALQDKVSSLENELRDKHRLSSALQPRQEHIEELTENVKEKERVIQAVLHEAALLREHRDVLLSQLQGANDSVEQLQKELTNANALSDDKAELVEQIESLQVCLQREEQERIRLRTRLDELTMECEAAQKAKEDIEHELEEANRQIDDLSAEQDNLISKHQQDSIALIDKFKHQISALQNSISSLSEKIEWYDSRHAEDILLIENLKECSGDTETKIVELQAKIDNLTREKNDALSKYEGVSKDNMALQVQNEDYNKHVQELEIALNESQTQVQLLSEECAKNSACADQEVMDNLKSALEKESAKCVSLVENVEKATELIANLKSENARLVSQANEQRTTQNNLKEELEICKTELESVKVSNALFIEGADTRDLENEERMAALQAHVDALAEEKVAIEAKYEAVLEDKNDLKQQRADAEERALHLEEQCRSIREELKKSLEKLRMAAESSEEKAKKSIPETLIGNLKEELEAEKRKYTSLVESAEKAAGVIRKLKSENLQLATKVNELSRQLEQERFDCRRATDNNKTLSEQLEQITLKNQDLQKHIAAHRESAVNQATIITSLREQIKHNDVELTRVEDQASRVIQELKSKIQSMEEDAMRVKRRHSDAESDSDDSLCRYSSKPSQHEAVINDLQFQVTSLQLEKHQCEKTIDELQGKIKLLHSEVESSNNMWQERLAAAEEDARRTQLDIESTERRHVAELERIHRKLETALEINETQYHSVRSSKTSGRAPFSYEKSEKIIDELVLALQTANREIARLKSHYDDSAEKWEAHILQIKKAVKEKYHAKLAHAKHRFTRELNSVVSMIQEECRAIYEEAESLAEKHRQELAESRKKALFPEMLSPEETQLLVQKILLRSTDAAALSAKSSVVSSLQRSREDVGASVLNKSSDKSVVTPGRPAMPSLHTTQSPDLQARQPSREVPRGTENDSADLTNRVRGLLMKLQNIPS